LKIGIISDIHGNYEALKAVLSYLDRNNVTEIYCLGDVVGYYSQVNECCNELRSRRIQCVLGNHDWYMIGGGFCPRSRSVNYCLKFQRQVITRENVEWLSQFPIQRRVENLHMVHGGWADPIDEYLHPTSEYFSRIDGCCFVSGHTHIPVFSKYESRVYCNPGSVGQPRDNDPRAAFAVFDGEFTICRVEYNMKKVFELMHQAGFNDYYYGCLQHGAKNLCKLDAKQT